MSNRRRYDDRHNYDRHSSGHRNGHRSGGSNWGWWAIGIFAAVAIASGGTGFGASSGGGHTPSHKSTVCTQYFKGGC
jgi:hypothetical protein